MAGGRPRSVDSTSTPLGMRHCYTKAHSYINALTAPSYPGILLASSPIMKVSLVEVSEYSSPPLGSTTHCWRTSGGRGGTRDLAAAQTPE